MHKVHTKPCNLTIYDFCEWKHVHFEFYGPVFLPMCDYLENARNLLEVTFPAPQFYVCVELSDYPQMNKSVMPSNRIPTSFFVIFYL